MGGMGVDSSGATEAESSNDTGPLLIINELLCFVQYHMHRSPRDNIAEVIYRFYDVEEIIKAKDALAVNYQGQFTYELKNRHQA